MDGFQRTFASFLTVGAGILALGCSSSSSPSKPCVAGAQVSCACPSGTTGEQVCKADGSGYGACDCGSPDAGSPDAGGPDAGGPDAGSPCDPVAQQGCGPDEKCTWVRTEVSPSMSGQLACVPNGSVGLGGNCIYGATGPTTGFDDCKAGAVCLAPAGEAATGTCKTLCDTAAPGTCQGQYTCSLHGGTFDPNSSLGLCDPTCDPLTQVRLFDNAPNCGGSIDNSVSPPQPSLGCYGLPSSSTDPSVFTCASAGNVANTSDVVCNFANGCGPYVNGCAPGYVPLLVASTGSQDVICVQLCSPVDTTLESHQNPGGIAPHACAAAHECRHWWYLEDATTPLSTYSNDLGYCLDPSKYQYDSNNDSVPDAPFPSCTSLSSSAHTFSTTLSDAEYWGCVAVTSK